MATQANVLDPDDMNSLNMDNLEKITASVRKRSVYEDWIDNLSFDANAKNIMKQVLDLTFTVGNKIYQIGKAIIEFIMSLKESYPKTFDLAALGFIFSLLVLAIPVIGKFLFPIIMPIFVAVGGIIGLTYDLGTEVFIKSKISDFFGIRTEKNKEA